MAVRVELKNASMYRLAFVLFGFWVLLSGRLDAMHLGFGLGSALLVSLFARSLLAMGRDEPLGGIRMLIRFVPYVGWLIYQIIIANIDVARRAISPRMPIYPGIIKVTSRFGGDLALTALANSITLTPGTMTVDVVGRDLYIHCLAIEDEQKLMEVERNFEDHVERLFGGRG
ncbi:MAG TPA: protein MnhE [Clostridiales bacterium]|nr:protein MnhE [Clostridiales bacterium]